MYICIYIYIYMCVCVYLKIDLSAYGRVLVLTTHYMDEADALADRIAVRG